MANDKSPNRKPLADLKDLHLETPFHRFVKLLETGTLHSNLEVIGLPGLIMAPPSHLRMYCEHSNCGTLTRFEIKGHVQYPNAGKLFVYLFLSYTCVNCQTSFKVFGLKADIDTLTVTKIYQEPPHGNPIPSRLFQIIGESNREMFLQARRSIARSLGIGAYAYYRRIVENNKFALIDSIVKLAEATGSAPEQIELLQKAQRETQFSKALDIVSDVAAVPAILLIDGHNPLRLLHDLLSEGIHQLSDEECLSRAKDAEIILSQIAVRMQLALTEHAEVRAAITNIVNRRNK